MKKQLLLISYALFSVIFITSCSVEKRIYRKGYNVEWNGFKRADPAQEETVVSQSKEDKKENASIDSLIQLSVDEECAIVEKPDTNCNCDNADAINKVLTHKKRIERRADFKAGFKDGFQIRYIADKPVLNLAVASFVLGLLSLITYYGAFVLGVLAIIFGAVALHRLRLNPDAYRADIGWRWPV